MLTKNKILQFTSTFSFLIFSFACGNSIQPASSAEFGDSSNQNSVIIGDTDWNSVSDLNSWDPIRRTANSVALISIPQTGMRCTGFLISENILMTNSHCVKNAQQARGLTANFQFERDIPVRQQYRYDCSVFLGHNPDLDYALLRCKYTPGNYFGYLDLDMGLNTEKGDDIYFVHQNCDYTLDPNCSPDKKVSEGQILNSNWLNVALNGGGNSPYNVKSFRYNADSLGGSSGAAVLSARNHKVIAIHDMEFNADDPSKNTNSGVSMQEIIPNLLKNFSDLNIPSIQNIDPREHLQNFEDILEPNNYMSQATLINQPFFSESDLSINSESDYDLFKIETALPKNLKTRIRFVRELGNLEFVLFDSTGQQILLSAQTLNGSEGFQYSNLPAGSYYLMVYGNNGDTNDYSLDVLLQNMDQETSNDIDSAIEIAPISRIKAGITYTGDFDFYSFESNSAKQINLTFDSSQGMLDIYLFDKNGNEMAKDESNNLEKGITLSQATGTYYIGIRGRWNSAVADYELTVK